MSRTKGIVIIATLMFFVIVPLISGDEGMSNSFLPWGLRLGGRNSADKANVEYDGKLRAIPTDATSTYARLKDLGKAPSDSGRVYSGQILDFGGDDDYIDCGDNAVNESNLITLLATCKIESTSGKVIVSGHYRVFELVIKNNNNFTLYYGDAINYSAVVLPVLSPLVSSEIYRVACAFDRSTGECALYLNGVLQSAGTGSAMIVAGNSDPLIIGSRLGGYKFFDGLIGNVQIWNKALTAEEVAADYANPENVDVTDPHLKGWWPLVEGSGSVCYDWSGNGNNGTLTNFDTATCWDAGKALSNPRVLQTAYMPFNLDAGVLRPIGTSGGVDFSRDYNELNWNGKTKASATTTIAKTVTLEAVINVSDVTALQYIMDGRYDSGTGYVNQTGGTIAASSGTVYVNGSASTAITAGMCHVVVAGLALDLTRLDLMSDNAGANLLTGQMPLFRLWYDVTWDAATVAEYFNKADKEYDL